MEIRRCMYSFFDSMVLDAFDCLVHEYTEFALTPRLLLGVGVLFSVLITAVITDAIKDAVGRPRPDFYWRCFPNGNPVTAFKLCCATCIGMIWAIQSEDFL